MSDGTTFRKIGYWLGAGSFLIFFFILIVAVITAVGFLLEYVGVPEPILSLLMAISIGFFVFLFGIKLVAGIQVTFKDAFWASSLGQVYPALASFVLGYLLSNHLTVGILLSLGTSVIFQSVLFRILIRAKGGTLSKVKSYILAVVMLASGLFIASPLVEFIITTKLFGAR